MKTKVATTVKIPAGIYDDFKVLGIRHKLSLQTLVEKCVNLYVNDDKFRETVNTYSLPKLSSDTPVKTLTILSGSLTPLT